MIALMDHQIFWINAALSLLLSFIVGNIIYRTKDSEVYDEIAKHMLRGADPIYGKIAAFVLFVQFWLLALMIWATFSANSSPDDYSKVILVQNPVAFNVLAGIIMLCNVICILIPMGFSLAYGFYFIGYGLMYFVIGIGVAIAAILAAVLLTTASVLLALLFVGILASILVAIIGIVFGIIILINLS